jgi:hypothetical protein
MEHNDTLRFMNDVDKYHLNSSVVWLESHIHHGQRKSSSHVVVNYENATRNNVWLNESHPFHAYIKKYGIPNVSFKACTRELKLNPMKSYLRSIGVDNYYTAIGIRDDESRRVSKTAKVENLIYPLIDIYPTDKQEVIDFWSHYEYDLRIPEWHGNCVTCYKKSFKKLAMVYSESPEVFEFNRFMEHTYPFVGPEFEKHGVTDPRVFFRTGLSTDQLIETFNVVGSENAVQLIAHSADSGCSESCEIYDMEG